MFLIATPEKLASLQYILRTFLIWLTAFLSDYLISYFLLYYSVCIYMYVYIYCFWDPKRLRNIPELMPQEPPVRMPLQLQLCISFFSIFDKFSSSLSAVIKKTLLPGLSWDWEARKITFLWEFILIWAISTKCLYSEEEKCPSRKYPKRR